ncbi:hypothetical protein Hanom_Chr09g00775051 [Helianthus anomalus]
MSLYQFHFHYTVCIDLSWRMHKVSDDQRRRVQICMGLLKEFKITIEQWLRKETDEERKRRKERKANGLPEFDRRVDGARVGTRFMWSTTVGLLVY